MKISDLKGKKITIMGLGLHGGGVGTAAFLSEVGAKVIITDLRSKSELASSIEKLKKFKNISYVLNQHCSEDFTKVDMVIKNPAVPWGNKYIKMALEHKVPVEMDSSLFFKLTKNKIIGITGTKGKTTTSSLIFEILKAAGKDVVKVGISQISVLDKLKLLKKDTVVVFELSSWRLSVLGRSKLSPEVAVITNLYPDHLNYYKSMREYVADKKNIFLFQKKKDICIINGSNQRSKELEEEIRSQLFKFSSEGVIQEKGAYIEDEAVYFSDGKNVKKIINVSRIKMKGEHNVSNVLAAVTVACTLGIDAKFIAKAVEKFSGVAHRLEFVKEIGGVKFYNDSAATTPESAISGLDSFSEPVILIAGGSDKNLDVSDFSREIAEKAKGVIFLKGAATEKMIKEIRRILDNSIEFKVVGSMEKAVELAAKEAEKGDVVLLSPGAASFGLFLNEFDRGNKFKDAVGKLK